MDRKNKIQTKVMSVCSNIALCIVLTSNILEHNYKSGGMGKFLVLSPLIAYTLV